MKLIVAGSRTLKTNHPTSFIDSVLSIFVEDESIDEIVAGGCPTGPDSWAKQLPEYFDCDYTEFSAEWDKYDKAAGPIRNKQMAHYADALLLIWTGDEKKSPGSANMKKQMEELDKPIYEVILREL